MIRCYRNVDQSDDHGSGDGLLAAVGHGWGDGQWYDDRGRGDPHDLWQGNEDMVDFDSRWWL